ncbi:MAG: AAA family ATPase [Treponema sp.]|nr:AAA family ATPase [Treponema sp.]
MDDIDESGDKKKASSANILRTVFEWFALHFEVIYPEQPISDTALLDDSASLKEYADFLHQFGTGIVGIEKEEVSEDKVKSSISIVDRASLEFRLNMARTNILLNREKREWSAVIRNRTNIFTIKMDRSSSVKYYVLKFIHQYGDEKVAYEMLRESDGTYRLFQLLEVLLTAKNKVFVIDEISRCMHPLLTIKFVETFLRLAAERTVQLVVTTHETRLMKHEFLRRDEVWLCENDGGISRDSTASTKNRCA